MAMHTFPPQTMPFFARLGAGATEVRLQSTSLLTRCAVSLGLGIAGLCAGLPGPSANAQAPISVDATVSSPAGPSSFQGGTSTSPAGHTLGLNSRYLLKDGKPWLPVMGEFHYTRVPEAEWEEEILKMKAAGVSIIATYVIWIHHEEVEGQFDWTGRRDLKRFVELCGKHGMYVYLRIGPWAHGEARNGGYPDWLLKAAPNNRQNDPTYLSYVTKYYNEVGREVHGELWKEGGPIVGIQLENEYARRGPNAGEAHILELKRLALAAGLDVPFYSVTGWDGAVVPHGAVIAVFGGYPDAPWDASRTDLPAQEVYVFRFGSRVTGNMGMMGLRRSSDAAQQYDYPFMTAEMGGGIQDTYHRRPVLQPDDVAAMVPVMLGSGVNLYGSYMFQGGENPEGKLTTLQESQRTAYPTDVPVKSYDFQAPLGEFGQEREVLRKLKVFDYFLQSFGPELAPMETHAPAVQPKSPEDLSVPRVAVRTKDDSGFLFFNNYVRNAAMPARPSFQMEIKLPGGTIRVPERPVTLPAGSYGIWPVGMPIGGARLRYATAQPFTRIQADGRTVLYFVVTPGVQPEFTFEEARGVTITAHGGTATRASGRIVVRGIAASLTSAITVQTSGKAPVDLVVLTREQAEQAWRVPWGNGERLLLSPDQFYNDGSRVSLDRNGDAEFHFSITPAVHQQLAGSAPLQPSGSSGASSFRVQMATVDPSLKVTQVGKAGHVPPVEMGPPVSWRAGVAMAPEDPAFAQAARWNISLPSADWTGLKDLFLDVRYNGDVARLTSGATLLDDDFYNGQVWDVGLRRFRSAIEHDGLQLEILPRRDDAPIFLERPFRSSSAAGQELQLQSVKLVPQYELTFALP